MNTLDILGDIIKSLEKEKEVKKSQPVRQAPQRRQQAQGFIKKSGAGGIIMDFGRNTSIHKGFQSYEHLLNTMGDPTQVQIANHQNNSFEKALDTFVEMGEDQYRQHYNEEEYRLQEEGKVNYEEAKKSYAHTATRIGNENVVATSETDAAVIEMFKAEMGEDFNME